MKNCFLSASCSVQQTNKSLRYKCCNFYCSHVLHKRHRIELATVRFRKGRHWAYRQPLQSNTGLQYTTNVKRADTLLHSILKAFDAIIYYCHSCLVSTAHHLGLQAWFLAVPSDSKRLVSQFQAVAGLVLRELIVLLFLVQLWPKIVRHFLQWLRKAWIQFDLLGAKVLTKVTKKDIKDDSVTSVPWIDTLLQAAEQPLILSLWVFALLRLVNLGALWSSLAFYAVESVLHTRVGENIVGHGLGKLSFVLLFGWFLERWRKMVFENAGAEVKTVDSMDRSLFLAYERLFQAVNYLIISFLLYEYVGVSFAPFFAISGLGGIALSLAARDFVSNVFGSIMIYLTRPFTVGDRIRSRDGGVNGTVEKIGWYSSEILNDEGMAVFVPNSTFTSAVLTNLSRVKKVPFQRKIAISKNYLQKMDNILEDIRRKLESHPMIDSTITPSIYVSEITDSYVEIEIRCTLRNSSGVDEKRARQRLLIDLGELEQQLRVAGTA